MARNETKKLATTASLLVRLVIASTFTVVAVIWLVISNRGSLRTDLFSAHPSALYVGFTTGADCLALLIFFVAAIRTLGDLRGKRPWTKENRPGVRLVEIDTPQSLAELSFALISQKTAAAEIFALNAGRRLAEHGGIRDVLRQRNDTLRKGWTVAVPERLFVERDKIRAKFAELARELAEAQGVHIPDDEAEEPFVDAEEWSDPELVPSHGPVAALGPGRESPFAEILRERQATDARLPVPAPIAEIVAERDAESRAMRASLGWNLPPELPRAAEPFATPSSAEIQSFDRGLLQRVSDPIAWCLADAIQKAVAKGVIAMQDVVAVCLADAWAAVIVAGEHHRFVDQVAMLGFSALGDVLSDKNGELAGGGDLSNVVQAARRLMRVVGVPTTKVWLFLPPLGYDDIGANEARNQRKRVRYGEVPALVPVGWMSDAFRTAVLVNLDAVRNLGVEHPRDAEVYATALEALDVNGDTPSPWRQKVRAYGNGFTQVDRASGTLGFGVGAPRDGWCVRADGTLDPLGLKLTTKTAPLAIYVLGAPKVACPAKVLDRDTLERNLLVQLGVHGPMHTSELVAALASTPVAIRKTCIRVAREIAGSAVLASDESHDALRSLSGHVTDVEEFRRRVKQQDWIGAFLLIRGCPFGDARDGSSSEITAAIWNAIETLRNARQTSRDDEVLAFALTRALVADPGHERGWVELRRLHETRGWAMDAVEMLIAHLASTGVSEDVLVGARRL
ncbi:MAG: hypothetical protein M1522_08770 [Actinobacteria bacterium]|nr:hypothetical protein [Actinomycetota bacterium]